MNLVTGATGILGSHVVIELLQQGQTVVACKQKNSSLQPIQQLFQTQGSEGKKLFDQIIWKEVDIRDIYSLEEVLEGISTVYHCAGLVTFHSKYRKDLFEINEGGTQNLVDACLSKGSVTLCHVSSVATINNSDYRSALNENVFWKTSGKESDYALSKYNAEREVWRGIEEGLKAVIVNPGVIMAPAYWNQSSSRLMQRAYRGNRFYTNGSAPYIMAKDVAQIMTQLIKEEHFAQRYILIENTYSFKEIMSLMQAEFHPGKQVKEISKSLLKCVALIEKISSFFRGKDPVLTQSLIQAAFTNQTYSNQKVKETLHFKMDVVRERLPDLCRMYKMKQKSGKASA